MEESEKYHLKLASYNLGAAIHFWHSSLMKVALKKKYLLENGENIISFLISFEMFAVHLSINNSIQTFLLIISHH